MFAIVKTLHALGFEHGDLELRNVAWTVDHHPVLVDLVTMRHRLCSGECQEISSLIKQLNLTWYEQQIWKERNVQFRTTLSQLNMVTV